MRNKKWTGVALAGGFAVVFAASVSAAYHLGGYGTATTYPGGGTGVGPFQPPSPLTNCSAAIRRMSISPDVPGGYPYVVDWTVVQANSLEACRSLVNSYLSRENERWELSPGNPWGCTCSEPGLGRVVDRGGYDVVRWDSVRDAALNVKLQALREEFRLDEYHQRVEQLVIHEVEQAVER